MIEVWTKTSNEPVSVSFSYKVSARMDNRVDQKGGRGIPKAVSLLLLPHHFEFTGGYSWYAHQEYPSVIHHCSYTFRGSKRIDKERALEREL